jgi:hypothetical protein
MPFTLSHPAAVLPLVRPLGRWGVWSALVVGSMAPDFPYYLGLPVSRFHGHSLGAVFWLCIPAGWAAYLLFQGVLRRPAVFLLPRSLRLRLDPSPHLGAPLAVTVSLALGGLTHVLWDAFTHGAGPLAADLPALRRLLIQLWGRPALPYALLQHGSTLLGATALAAAGLRWLRQTKPAEPTREPPGRLRLRALGRGAALLLPSAAGLSVALLMGPPLQDVRSVAWFAVHVAVAGLSTLVLLLVLLSAVLHARESVSPSA